MKLKDYIKRKAHSLAHRAGKKPMHALEVGVEVKACEDRSRGDCPTCAIKKEFERLVNLRTCNDCGRPVCDMVPKIGETVRINCFFWIPRPSEEVEETWKENE